jgi:lipopolysaccharide/colanic/teichoic acid biosynthesis glycosyltransferase
VRQFSLAILDTTLILFATLIALGLRKDLELTGSGVEEVLPYFGATAIAAIIIVAVSQLNKTMWCYRGPHNYLRVISVVVAVCVGAVCLCFAWNRLEGVPRSLPFLQALVSIMVLEGARVLYKLHRALRSRAPSSGLMQLSPTREDVSVLVVGASCLTEAYLLALSEARHGHVNVAGLLTENPGHVGRLFSAHPILGMTEDIEGILDGLDVQGVTVDRIIVATPFSELSENGKAALIRTECLRCITLQRLTDSLDLNIERRQKAEAAPDISTSSTSQLRFELDPAEIQAFCSRPFLKIKRVMDVFAAVVLILFLAPVMLLVAVFVAANMGFPVEFWQRRPGLGGKPFHLYKFRTMRAGHTPDGRRLSDAERVSRGSKFLRRSRLDELPQLFNILRGDMSLIGPRPLLAKELPRECAARFLVRPGLTGWAQVVGGRDISAMDKLALDIWYVRNASFILDLEIGFRTIPVILFGERISEHLIERAWRDLNCAGSSI